jgi:hypothetical protein
MQKDQTVSEMAEEVLVRQAKTLAHRSGQSLEEARQAVADSEAGRQLRELATGEHRYEKASEWQVNVFWDRAEERRMHHVGSEALSRFVAERHYYEEPNVSAPRVLIAIEPRMYAEVLAFSIGQHRPHAEVSLLSPSEELEDAVLRLRPHLVVANSSVPQAAGGGRSFFWVEMAQARAGEGAKRLGARIEADGYSKDVADVSTAHVLAALDRAEGEFVLKGRASEASSA